MKKLLIEEGKKYEMEDANICREIRKGRSTGGTC
jgi:hypothetical protein